MSTSGAMVRLMRAGVVLPAALALLATSNSRLPAQADPDLVKQRNDCRLAEQVLRTGHPGPKREDALTTIGLCGTSAVPTLIALWSGPAMPRAELAVLVTSTRAVVTEELVAALLAVAEEPRHSTEQRVGALLVLTTYADSAALPGFQDLIGPADSLIAMQFGHVDHPAFPVGRERLTEPVMGRLRAALERMKGGDPNPDMRTAARVLLLNLKSP